MDKFAIIGFSCLFPGASSPEEFWRNLLAGKDSRVAATKKQFGVEPEVYTDPHSGFTEPLFGIYGGYVKDFISDNNSPFADDCYQWTLYAATEALKDSKYLAKPDVLAKCGMVLGNVSFPTKNSQQFFSNVYLRAVAAQIQDFFQIDLKQTPIDHLPPIVQENFISGFSPASFVAKALGLKGACFAIDAACASFFYAIDIACKYLSDHKVDLMLVGGLNASDPFFINVGFSVFHAYAKNNNSWPLNQDTDGLIPGEGAGFVVLKRYADALKDNDNILAVIVSSGLSNDGSAGHALLPHVEGQMLAFKRAYKNVNHGDVAYIEMHATGTKKGDVVELKAIEDFFGQDAKRLLVGAVKANTGHLLSAAGAVSLIKMLLALKHNTIPATIGIVESTTTATKAITSKNVVSNCREFPSNLREKMIGINAFGFGGSNAHLVIAKKEAFHQQQIHDSKKQPTPESLVIIGMAAYFGTCIDLLALKNLIQDSGQCFGDFPQERWQGMEKIFGANFIPPKGAYISALDIDPLYFKISPKELNKYNPQYLLMLKVADQAIKDAGYKKIVGRQKNVAVIIAMHTEPSIHGMRARCDAGWLTKDFNHPLSLRSSFVNQLKDYYFGEMEVNQFLSYIGNIIATHISSLWNFNGPAYTVSGGKNSVFKAIENAQLLLQQDQELEAVLVGGVDLAAGFASYLLNNKFHTIGSGKGSSGWSLGEGAGAIVICRQKDVPNELAKVYAKLDAVEISYGFNSDKISEIVAVSNLAMQKANIQPEQIGYLETTVGGFNAIDDLESKVLTVLYPSTAREPSCVLGSIKTNIGNTCVASGMASIIKTALCLYHKMLPGVPNWNDSARNLPYIHRPFYVLQKSRYWFLSDEQRKRIAGISSLAADNSYAHLLLSEASTPGISDSIAGTEEFMIAPIYGNDSRELVENLDKLKKDVNGGQQFLEIMREWKKKFIVTPSRFVLSLVGANKESLLKEIAFAYRGLETGFNTGAVWQTPSGSYFTVNPLKNSKVAFVYPPNGLSYINQGESFFSFFPVTMAKLQEQFFGFTDKLGKIVYPRSLHQLTSHEILEYQQRFNRDPQQIIETGIFFSLTCAKIMQEELGINPSLAFGVSMGEVSMLLSHGIWQDISLLSKRLYASDLFKFKLEGKKQLLAKFWPTENVTWCSYVLLTTKEEVLAAMQGEKGVFLTFINSHNEVVISGIVDSCLRVIRKLQAKFVVNSYQGLLHTPLAMAVYDEMVAMHDLPVNANSNISFLSAANYEETTLNSTVLANNIAKIYTAEIDFPRLVNKAYHKGARVFIECGPTNSCTKWINDTLKNREYLAINPLGAKMDDKTSLTKMLAKLISHQILFDVRKFLSPSADENLGSRRKWKVQVGGETIRSILHKTN